MIKITVERRSTVWEKSRDWKQFTNDPGRQFAYVDAELPREKRVTLIEQEIEDESSFDLAGVIKAINKL